MPAKTTAPRLTERFHEALTYAVEKHHTQTPQGSRYYRSLLHVYQRRTDSWLVEELRRTLDVLEEERVNA